MNDIKAPNPLKNGPLEAGDKAPDIAFVEDRSRAASAKIQITVVVGLATIRIRDLLKMGRGAVISLDTLQDDEVRIYAADKLIARGKVVVRGNEIQVSITGMLDRNGRVLPETEATPGST